MSDSILTNEELQWMGECIAVYTVGAIPSYKDYLEMDDKKQEFFYQFAKEFRKLEEAKKCFYAGNFRLGAYLYDQIKPVFERSMSVIFDIAEMRAETERNG